MLSGIETDLQRTLVPLLLNILQLNKLLCLYCNYMTESRKNWTEMEDRAILSCVKKYGMKNWVLICDRMATRFGVQSRTSKQCRERWYNHLDPKINKEKWSNKQEKLIFEAHQKYGNQWTKFTELFIGRTDNDIKNHFYSMLRKSLRRINKVLGLRDSTKTVRFIRPSVLSRLFHCSEEDGRQEECKKISEMLFTFSKAKSKIEKAQMDEQRRGQLKRVLETIIAFNEEYVRNKEHRDEMKAGRERSPGAQITNKSSRIENTRGMGQTESKSRCASPKKKTSRLKISRGKAEKSQKKKVAADAPKEAIVGRPARSVTSLVRPSTTEPKGKRNGAKPIPSAQFDLPEQNQEDMNLPDLDYSLSHKRSSLEIRGSSIDFSFCLANSPRFDMARLRCTPPSVSPGIDSIANMPSLEWGQTNNEDMDGMLWKIRKNIQRNSGK